MTKLIEVRYIDGTTYKVLPRWRGQNLAVHAPVIGGSVTRRGREWVITHLASGYHAGGHFYGTLSEAVLAARLWDEAFGTATVENASRWPLREQWKRIIRNGYAERPWRSIERVREILACQEG
jgi:hypothetical protein